MSSRTVAVTKKTLSALEKIFAAEIEDRLPFQSKATIDRDLMAANLVQPMQRTVGTGWSAVTVSGVLTDTCRTISLLFELRG